MAKDLLEVERAGLANIYIMMRDWPDMLYCFGGFAATSPALGI